MALVKRLAFTVNPTIIASVPIIVVNSKILIINLQSRIYYNVRNCEDVFFTIKMQGFSEVVHLDQSIILFYDNNFARGKTLINCSKNLI